jgi:hypothetical protein
MATGREIAVLLNSAAIPLPTPKIPLPTSSFDINQPIDLNDNSVVKGALFASEKTFSSAGREPVDDDLRRRIAVLSPLGGG